jgi:hypothetical protein
MYNDNIGILSFEKANIATTDQKNLKIFKKVRHVFRFCRSYIMQPLVIIMPKEDIAMKVCQPDLVRIRHSNKSTHFICSGPNLL